MIEKLKEWDEVCVNWTEARCHWIQSMFGVTNFLIAKLLVLLDAILTIVIHNNSYYGLMMAGVSIVTRIFIIVVYEQVLSKGDGKTANPCRYQPVFIMFRIGFAMFAVADCVMYAFGYRMGLNELIRSFLVWVFYLLMACAPLPPGSSKIGDWVRSLFVREPLGEAA